MNTPTQEENEEQKEIKLRQVKNDKFMQRLVDVIKDDTSFDRSE
jgi:hypothetical protein